MTFLTTAVLVTVLVLVLLFIFKKYIVLATDFGLKIVFGLCAVVVILALFYAPPFLYLSDNSLHGIGIYTSLENADRRIQSLQPGEVVEGVGDWFNNLFNKGNQGQPKPDDYEPGFLMTEIYPNMMQGLAVIYRVLTVILGLLLMVFAIYFGYSTYGAARVLHLEVEVAKLKQSIAELQNLH